MKPFRSIEEMLDAHEAMFGSPGRKCAEIVQRWATTLFAVPLDTLNIRVVLAPVELGPYNRHAGYHYSGQGAFILGNRHIVRLKDGTLELVASANDMLNPLQDFIIRELTHARQHQLLREHPEWKVTRGHHRDRGWYAAIAEACPRYLSVEFPPSSWPTGPRTRKGTLTEVEARYWPHLFRDLVLQRDARLPEVRKAA